jgi:hypothetical protein
MKEEEQTENIEGGRQGFVPFIQLVAELDGCGLGGKNTELFCLCHSPVAKEEFSKFLKEGGNVCMCRNG